MTTRNTLTKAIALVLTGSVLPSMAWADDTPMVDLGTLSASFENRNRYAVPESSNSVGLTLENRETPQMVSILNKARIKDQNLKTMKDVVDNTTGINISNIDGGRVNFSSRGFNINQFSVDGADMDFNQQMSVGEYHLGTDIFDKIEVTHGSTGLVSGSGEPSARINLVRKKAIYDNKGEISLNANRFGNFGASLDYARALTTDGTVRGRVVASHQDGKTFTDREKKGQSVIYATVQTDIGDDGTLDVGAMYRKNKQIGTMWGGLPSYYSDGTRTDWHAGKSSSVDWARWDNAVKEYFLHLDQEIVPDWRLNIKATHNDTKGNPKLFYHGYHVVDKATGLGVVDNPEWATSRYRADNTHKQTHLQADIIGRFSLFDQDHQLMAGVHRNSDKLTAHTYPALDKATITNMENWDGSYPEPAWGARKKDADATVKTTEQSLYAATQLKLATPLSVVLGSRLSSYDKKGVQWGRQVSAKAKGVLTPYAGVVYDINDNHSLYASYTSIFQPQTARDVNGDYLKAMTGNTAEIGFKSSSLDGKLQGQIALFSVKQDNLAKALPDTFVKGTEKTTKEQAYTITQGNKSKGIELEMSGKLTPHWQMMASFSKFYAKDNQGEAINTTSPNQMVKLWTIYDFSQFVNGLIVGGGVNWFGERYAMLTNPASKEQERYTQKPVTLINMMARYQALDNLEMQLNISNALNQKHLTGLSGRWGQIIYGEPLNVSGSMTYRF